MSREYFSIPETSTVKAQYVRSNNVKYVVTHAFQYWTIFNIGEVTEEASGRWNILNHLGFLQLPGIVTLKE